MFIRHSSACQQNYIYEVLYTVNADNWVEVIVWLPWDGKLKKKWGVNLQQE